MESQKKNVVIIGGGAAGILIARTLSRTLDASKFNLKLINERSFHIIWPAMYRAVTTAEGSFGERGLIPYDKFFAPGKLGEIIAGSVISVKDDIVHLADGRTIDYDWLVVATGTTWRGPLEFPLERAKVGEWLDEWHTKLSNAKEIVMVGGGSAGIEFSGEIRHFLPDKKVTVIHSQDQLLNATYPPKYRQTVLDAAATAGINMIFKDRAHVPVGPCTSVKTENGLEIPTDLVIDARGGKLNTAFLTSLDPTVLTPSGSVKVLPTLQVPLSNGKSNVFALGDIIEWPEQKTIFKVRPQAAIVAANLLSAINGTPLEKTYDGHLEVIAIPCGPYAGRTFIPWLWGIILGDFFTSNIHSKHLSLKHHPQLLVAPEFRGFFSRLLAYFF
ncbi:hypothetical protein FRB95_008512 [Tulasnella sp. JGI-2019a]|nr:hypothetical protein FRB95_008512 [Tulasnella sp. JGI-2019a]